MTYEPVPEPSPLVRAAKIVAAIGLTVLGAVVVVGGGSYLGRLVGSALGEDTGGAVAQVDPGLPVTVEIPSGATGRDIAAILAAHGVVRTAAEFESAVRSADAAANLKAGVYELETLMNPNEVVAILITGPGPAVYRVTVVEGLRVAEILTGLAEASGHDYDEFEAALLGGEVATSLREMPASPSLSDWEGLLFPDTYEFSRSAEPAAILQRLATTMEQRTRSIDWTVLESTGLTVYEGMIVASLIESEVRVEEERPLVSSVIHNRLAIGMKLDIDATVYYALGTRQADEFDREVDSPYNTYLYAGLPPTPISAPGRASLEAAAHPADTEYLFYVLADLEGNHAFAETIEEHNANVQRAREDGIIP